MSDSNLNPQDLVPISLHRQGCGNWIIITLQLPPNRINELINGQLDPNGKKHMQNMASRMALKFDKYLSECDLLLSFGSILDPRYKKGVIEYALISMYPTDYEAKIKQVENNFNSLYDEYALIYGDPKGKGPAQYNSYLKQPPSTSVGKKKFDVFMLKMQSNGKGVLSIPITTVASESTFNVGGRVIDKKRASMRRDTIEVLLCAGDWIKEMYGIRSVKEAMDDPVELEYENEFEMKDPNAPLGTQENEEMPSTQVSTQVTQQSTPTISKRKHQTTTQAKNPKSKKPSKKARRT
ncbi:hypothetical protein OROMI_007591 [Orobanche minor]